jgi:transposase
MLHMIHTSRKLWNDSLAKSILDAGWAQLVRFARHKARLVDSTVLRVPAAYSTQACCLGGQVSRVGLEVREFENQECHNRLNRDVNAANAVLKRGVAKVGQHSPNLKPVEAGSPHLQTTGEANPVIETETTSPANGAGNSRLQSREDIKKLHPGL